MKKKYKNIRKLKRTIANWTLRGPNWAPNPYEKVATLTQLF